MSELHAPRSITIPAAKVGEIASIDLPEWCARNNQPHRLVAEPSSAHFLLKGLEGVGAVVPYTYPRMFIARVADADLVAPHGLVITPDGQMAFKALGARDDSQLKTLSECLKGPDQSGQYSLHRPTPQYMVEHECVFLGGHGPPGHFLGQDLMRLAQVAMLPEVAHLPIAVYDTVSDRNLQFLDLVGYPASRRITIPARGAVRFKTAWMASSPLYRLDTIRACLWPDAVWWLRSQTAKLINRTGRSRTRLAIPRKAPDWRFAVNQPEIDAVLARAGISVIDIPAQTATETVKSMADAELIVTFGGVSGEHTMFAPPDCVIIEVAAPEWVGAFGPRAFAAVLGQPFARLVSTPASPPATAAAGLTVPVQAQEGRYTSACHFVTDCSDLAGALVKADVAISQIRPV